MPVLVPVDSRQLGIVLPLLLPRLSLWLPARRQGVSVTPSQQLLGFLHHLHLLQHLLIVPRSLLAPFRVQLHLVSVSSLNPQPVSLTSIIAQLVYMLTGLLHFDKLLTLPNK